MSRSAPSAAAAKHPAEVLTVLLLAGLVYALSQTLVIPALPAIRDDLGASAESASWVLTGFLLSASVATPIIGKLGDLFGKGRTLVWALLVFSVGSLVCALAPSIEVLIVGRLLQGTAGGIFPLAFGIIRDTFPPARVGGAIGLLSATFGIGGGIGLPLSGVIVDHADSSIIFWLGLTALPAALAVHRLVPASPPKERTRVDWAGAVLLSVALVLVLLPVTEAASWGWGSVRVIGMLAGGLAVGAVWLAVEARREEPLIDLRVLRERAVATTNLAAFLVGVAMYSTFILIPAFAQSEGHGYGFADSVTTSGLLLLPCAMIQLGAGPLGGTLGARFGFRSVLAAGAALLTVSFVLLAAAHEHPWQVILGGMFLGAGVSFAFAAMANLIVEAVPQSDVGIATGINTIMRTVGGAFGSAAATAILAAQEIPGTSIPAEKGYTLAFLVAAGGSILALGAALLVPRPGRDDERGRGEPAPAPARAA